MKESQVVYAVQHADVRTRLSLITALRAVICLTCGNNRHDGASCESVVSEYRSKRVKRSQFK